MFGAVEPKMSADLTKLTRLNFCTINECTRIEILERTIKFQRDPFARRKMTKREKRKELEDSPKVLIRLGELILGGSGHGCMKHVLWSFSLFEVCHHPRDILWG